MIVLIPAAGGGRRFADVGYTFPKPLIDVKGKPMIERVVDNLRFPNAKYVFLVQREHIDRFGIDEMLDRLADDVTVIPVDGVTEGAACTALLAKEHIETNDELIIANSDQVMDFSMHNFNTLREWTSTAGIVFSFHAMHPKWSFCRLDGEGKVTEVVEKRPISNVATCGVYYYRKGKYFVSAAQEMIRRNDRTNGEFYIAPAYNYLIDGGLGGGLVLPYYVDRMHGMGTPEDLDQYLRTLR